MNALALPRIGTDAAAATHAAVAAGMNGVTHEIRQHALRKVRGAVRRGRIEPATAAAALRQGDQGIAALFPVAAMPAAPALTAASFSGLSGATLGVSLGACRWFIDLALRRNCVALDLLDTLSSPETPPAARAACLVDAWNRLLESYRPEWLPQSCEGERPRLLALPSALLRPDPYADHAPAEQPIITITPMSISRLFIDVDEADAPALVHALRTLDQATVFLILGADPLLGREMYSEYSAGYELFHDVRQHVTWPVGSEEPVADLEGIAVLLEEFGLEGSDADTFAQAACDDMALARRFDPEASPAGITDALARATSPASNAARSILDLAQRLAAMPTPRNRLSAHGENIAPVVQLIGTFTDDARFSDIEQAIDMECQESALEVTFHRSGQSMSELDRQLERLVAEMMVADLVYALVLGAQTELSDADADGAMASSP